MMNTHSIEHKFNALPDNLRKEVLDFIDFLMTRKNREVTPGHFDFRWEGGLSDLKDQYNSVDLQHQSMEWR
uniref:DUF2281 domain-containing protein n=1 Tax=Candidatus Kentrum sp. FW TaxID=2126338 RepID=A0A450U2L5_9GAMM|nr:MAG: Protein of unknown function (DUF2281) [Candidatus Kentron sp. FW]